MPVRSSFPQVADQIISFNKNIIDILSKLNSLTTTTDSSVELQLFDENGILKNINMPSFNSLKNEIDRLNNNITSLYSLDVDGALIQTKDSNKFKKIISVNLNREPNSLSSIGIAEDFKLKTNWFFDSMINPMLQVEYDLSGKIDETVNKCLVRRYIINFESDIDGITERGFSAINSFNDLFRNNANISLNEFLDWHKTTIGVAQPNTPSYDEDTFDLEPNSLQYDGEFNVLKIQEDRLNRKLWYMLNTIDYVETQTGEIRQLTINDELIVNTPRSSTRYKVIEVSLAESSPRVRFERIEGIEPIPVGIKTLKIYSPIVYNKNIRINVSPDERNIIFIKPINTNSNIIARNWSLGSGFYTNDLRLSSNDSNNGTSMEDFYKTYVHDYGKVLKDLTAKKIIGGEIPNPPALDSANFKVVQINKHLTENSNKETLKTKHNTQMSLKTELIQMDNAISNRMKQLKVAKFKSISDKKQFQLELEELANKKDSKTKLLRSVNREIIELTTNSTTSVKPKYRLRGFWDFPEAVKTSDTKPQEVIQFKIQYRYVSIDGSETPIEQYNTASGKAIFSNWEEIITDSRDRIYDKETGIYHWVEEDIETSNDRNINSLDIPIQAGERVEFRIKSISEAGWPESPIESPWTEIISIPFPSDLNNVISEQDYIIMESNKEDIRSTITDDLESKGIFDHLSNTVIDGNKKYDHTAEFIYSGFRDTNNIALSVFEVIQEMKNEIHTLKEKLERAKGIMEITILKNNEEFLVDNGSETTFNVVCEDYLTPFSGQGVPTGRVYENNIYVIKDFVLRIRNASKTSPLGLLSDKDYINNARVYNPDAPQVFWVNDLDEILRSDVTSDTRTQLNNQFIWNVNFTSMTDNSVTRLSDNIGNAFTTTSINSLVNVLSSTEYNIGYNEASVLKFHNDNDSLLELDKWLDTSTSVDSTVKLLTSIHPVVKDLENIQETGFDKTRVLKPEGENNEIIIPINIYFKMNSLDSNQVGENYEYINLNRQIKTIRHVKRVKFMFENESENRPFECTIKFNITRNNVIHAKTAPLKINLTNL